ncbi:MAG: efflux RND transporter periplasmic adaptor subunit [Candidatus Cloacimonetes bacterium]|nr:efflux RND transporter periplasmic adaptor subunit [Candidatus Cloacimonadota bacterium]
MKKFLIIIGIIIIIIVIISFAFRGKQTGEHQQTVRSVEVRKGSISVVLEETGEIQPIREIDIKSRISGKVIKFFVDEGDFVNNGDIIAEIEPDFNQANQIANIRNNLHLSRIRLDNAQKDYDRKQTLFERQFIAKDEVDNALDDLETATINYQSALQQFELIQEIDTEGNVSRIFSTASGTVIQKMVEEGEMVISSTSSFSDGTVIVKLADLNQMVVNSFINEVDIAKVYLTQQARIQVDAFPYETFTGVVSKIGAMAVTRNNVKVFPIEIRIIERETPLMPGMTANVTIFGETKEDIIVIPIRAIFSDEEGQDIVYKVVNDSISTGTLIKTGINDFQQVEIIEGLAEGEKVSLIEPSATGQQQRPAFIVH